MYDQLSVSAVPCNGAARCACRREVAAGWRTLPTPAVGPQKWQQSERHQELCLEEEAVRVPRSSRPGSSVLQRLDLQQNMRHRHAAGLTPTWWTCVN